jgi:thioesterase domain-containing protein
MMSRRPEGASRTAIDRGHVVALKAGAEANKLFMFPGAGCDWREVALLAASVEPPWSVIGVEAWRPPGSSTELPRTVEQMGSVAHAAIKAAQPHGPYYLAGYSFGGLLALEAADALVRCGDQVAFLALIDSNIYHRRWSLAQRLRGRFNQIVRFLQMPAATRLEKASGHADYFASRLAMRLRRQSPPPQTTLERCEAAYKMYRPRAYPGRVCLLSPDRSRELGVDLAELWKGYVGALDVSRVVGGHHELMRSRQHVEVVARALNDALRGAPTIGPRASDQPTAQALEPAGAGIGQAAR